MIPPYHLLLPRSTSPFHDLLLQQPSFGDTTALTRKIEEICARRTITLLVVIVLGVVAITGTKVEVLVVIVVVVLLLYYPILDHCQLA